MDIHTIGEIGGIVALVCLVGAVIIGLLGWFFSKIDLSH